MQKYNAITVLNLPDCRINAFGVMQIAEMLTNIGCLRDLNLDMNPNAQENFHLLCQPAGKLQFLTLRHCQISDEGAKKIANELQYRDPPNGPKLISLSLSNNRITCNGAAYLGSMLRTNRSLRSLSLVANRICDDGAWLIIRELKITTLTHEEVVDLRRRKFEELAIAEELLSKQSNDSVEEALKKNNKSRLVRNSSRRSKKSSIDMSMQGLRTGSVVRDLESAQKKKVPEDCEKNHPFRTECYPINGMLVSIGNLCLQYLDLSYNYLTKYTLRDLIKCLYYQNFLLLGDTSTGLLHVVLEGGNFETEDEANWTVLEELLENRRNGGAISNEAFQDFVPPESEILREKIKASENGADNSSKN
ncbi:uncharacterized protein LOC143355653 [Halictus rubicundus]|uniref:uncharacterized protein LOC143355653 n=1 Tax=Halictus rubicundus TaxID=77578 RepID=UPI004036C3E8